jgi:2-dehydropantoate 2-reductase
MNYLPRKARIAAMGAGAIGSVIGGMLARDGHSVTLVGRKTHMDAIMKDGLHISGIWGDYTVRDINAVTEPPHEHQDIVFLTVKSFDTARAAVEAVPMI